MDVKSEKPAKRTRVISYIDGFNLYFGLREMRWRKYMWLDLTKLSASIILPNCDLEHTKYFTSRIRGNIGKAERQSAFLDALQTLPNLTIYYGHFQTDRKQCQRCGHYAYHPQEKKTDVNIATQLLCDAFHDRFDTALVVSGDADLVPPIEAVKKLFPAKKVVIAFPPKRYSSELAATGHARLNIYETKFRQSKLSEVVELPSGIKVSRPDKWK
jgi:uncharacterized LabA/DUF88 family protein